MPYARFNTGDAPLSDEFTPADPMEDAATTSFQPFEPELLEGLSERMLTRLQRLETLLTKMEAADLGTPATKLESQLLRMHEHIRSKLEKRMERRANRTGKSRRKLKRKLKVLRARRKVRRLGGSTGSSADRHLQVQKAKKIQQIREHHAAGKISTGHANYLIRAAIAGKRPTEARDIAIEAGGVRKVGVVERAIASGAKDRFTSRRIAV
jgi:hypothetical protein